MLYGVLKTSSNTGLDSELAYIFATPLSILSNQPVFKSDSISGIRKVASRNVQRWEIEATVVPTNNDAGFAAHSIKNGFDKIIYIRMPQIYRSVNSMTTPGMSLTLQNNIFINDNIISFAGLSGQLALGEMITFNGDPKVYMVVDTGSNGINAEIYPRVRKNIAAGTTISYGGNVVLRARYDDSVSIGIRYEDGILMSPGSYKFIEAL